MSDKKKMPGRLAVDVAVAITAALWTVMQVMGMRWVGDYDCSAFDIMLLLLVNAAVIYARRGTLWLTEG